MPNKFSRSAQPDSVDIGFAGLLILAWTLLAWFGQHQQNRMPLAIAGLALLCAGFSYSLGCCGSVLPRIGWRWPARRRCWALAILTGTAAAGAVLMYFFAAGKSLPIADHRAAVWIEAATVGPILEEVIFRGLILSGLLYMLDKVRLPRGANAWASILVAAILFGLAHHGRTGFALGETTAVGILYGWLRVRSGSTAVAAVSHSSFNLALHLLIAM